MGYIENLPPGASEVVFAEWYAEKYGRKPSVHEVEELYQSFEAEFLCEIEEARVAAKEKEKTIRGE